jgi:hypothetical protein
VGYTVRLSLRPELRPRAHDETTYTPGLAALIKSVARGRDDQAPARGR